MELKDTNTANPTSASASIRLILNGIESLYGW